MNPFLVPTFCVSPNLYTVVTRNIARKRAHEFHLHLELKHESERTCVFQSKIKKECLSTE